MASACRRSSSSPVRRSKRAQRSSYPLEFPATSPIYPACGVRRFALAKQLLTLVLGDDNDVRQSVENVHSDGGDHGAFALIGGYLGGPGGMLMALLFSAARPICLFTGSPTAWLRMYNAREVDEVSAPHFYE